MIDVAKLHDSADILRDCYPGVAQHEAIKALWLAHDELLKANNNLCAQLAEVVGERDRANDALKLYRADRDFAHRLAVMLECVLLGGKGTWDAGHTLLDEYREACRDENEPPTCMGEPITHVRAHVRAECQHCGGLGEVTGEYPGVACPDCAGSGFVTPNG